MKKLILLTLTIMCSTLCHAQFVEKVKYLMKFNEDNCRHEVYLVVEEGTATNTVFRTQASSQMSIVVPSECGVSVVQRYNPINLNGQPNSWNITSSDNAPTIDPDHNYHSITPVLGANARYTQLVEGDTIHLYDLLVTPAINGPEGIRFYENGVDYDSADGLNGDFTNGFTVGTINQLYNGNAPQVYPSKQANLAGPSTIYVGYETEIAINHSNGTWSSSDPGVATLSTEGTITGVAPGSTIVTFDPNSGCNSSVSVAVSALADPENVGIGTNTPHPSAILDLESNSKGLLLPRMTAQQRRNIPSPAEGLMVYQYNGSKGFYYFDGDGWKLIQTATMTGNFTVGDTPFASLRKGSPGGDLEKLLEKQEQLFQLLADQEKQLKELLGAE